MQLKHSKFGIKNVLHYYGLNIKGLKIKKVEKSVRILWTFFYENRNSYRNLITCLAVNGNL